MQLVASELVTNAVLHAPGSPTVTVELLMDHGCVRILVSDHGRDEPERRHSSEPLVAESGRGVWIIDALADHWGTETNERGEKTVWCELNAEPTT